ncbi:hypothetical protein [Tumidithrix helvetica]|uniref:hypothetical protein n=1 Tax=Tumidithrix helvetica TaxID=3457545 RepID=UPI003CC5A1C3
MPSSPVTIPLILLAAARVGYIVNQTIANYTHQSRLSSHLCENCPRVHGDRDSPEARPDIN